MRLGFDPWVRKVSWRRKWQPAPVFLPGESHGQRSLAGCSCGVAARRDGATNSATTTHGQIRAEKVGKDWHKLLVEAHPSLLHKWFYNEHILPLRNNTETLSIRNYCDKYVHHR